MQVAEPECRDVESEQQAPTYRWMGVDDLGVTKQVCLGYPAFRVQIVTRETAVSPDRDDDL